jgi:hypothetical protein
LWHGGGENRSDAPRLGVNVLYAEGWLRQDENQYHAVSRKLAATLPPPLQCLLGYGVYGEYLGYLDGRHPPASAATAAPAVAAAPAEKAPGLGQEALRNQALSALGRDDRSARASTHTVS